MEILRSAMDPAVGLRAVMALLALKVVLASFAAMRGKSFDWRALPEFVESDVLPYGGGLLILWILATYVDPVILPMYTAASAALSTMFLRQCWTHLKDLFGVDASV